VVEPPAVLGAAVPAATVLGLPLTPEDDVPGEHAVAAVTTRMATGSRRTASSWTTQPDKRLVVTPGWARTWCGFGMMSPWMRR
jgi:hypothetical protein